MKDKTRPKSCVGYASLTSDNYGTIPHLRQDPICKPQTPARSQFLRSLCQSRRYERADKVEREDNPVEDGIDLDRNVSIEVDAPAFNETRVKNRNLPQKLIKKKNSKYTLGRLHK